MACSALATLAGCTSLLGDFGDSGQASDGGSSDATLSGDAPTDAASADEPRDAGRRDAANDASVQGDGASDAPAGDAQADAAPPPLSCGTWLYPTPVVIDSLEGVDAGSRLISGAPAFYLTSGNTAKIVTSKPNGVPFSVYTLDKTMSPPGVTRLDAPASATTSVLSLHRSPSRVNPYTAALTVVKPAMSASYYAVYVLGDTLAATGPVPAPFTVYSLTPTQATPSSVHLLPMSSSEMFMAVENPVVSGGITTYDLGVGLATSGAAASLFPVQVSNYRNDFTQMALFHNNATGIIDIYAQNDVTSQPGLSAWAVADTVPAEAGAPTKRPVGALSAVVRDIGENSNQPMANIAYEEYGLNGVFITSLTLRAGAVNYSSANDAGGMPTVETWVSTDLPIVKTFTGNGLFAAPASYGIGNYNCGSTWVGNNIMLLGPGVHAAPALDAGNGGVPFGLNALWVDATGTIHSDMTGTNRLLPALGDFSAASAAPISIAADFSTAKWGVVMIETKTDTAGSYSVVEYNELDCQ